MPRQAAGRNLAAPLPADQRQVRTPEPGHHPARCTTMAQQPENRYRHPSALTDPSIMRPPAGVSRGDQRSDNCDAFRGLLRELPPGKRCMGGLPDSVGPRPSAICRLPSAICHLPVCPPIHLPAGFGFGFGFGFAGHGVSRWAHGVPVSGVWIPCLPKACQLGKPQQVPNMTGLLDSRTPGT